MRIHILKRFAISTLLITFAALDALPALAAITPAVASTSGSPLVHVPVSEPSGPADVPDSFLTPVSAKMIDTLREQKKTGEFGSKQLKNIFPVDLREEDTRIQLKSFKILDADHASFGTLRVESKKEEESRIRQLIRTVKGLKLSMLLELAATPVYANDLDPFMERYDGIEEDLVDFALLYLNDQQPTETHFSERNKFEQTGYVVNLLARFGFQSNERFQAALQYMRDYEPTNNRERAIKIRLLNSLNEDYQAHLDVILASRSTEDGGYGYDKGYMSDMATTIEVLNTLAAINYFEDNSIAQAIGYMVHRIPDSGEIRHTLDLENSNASYYLVNRALVALKPFENTSVGVEPDLIRVQDKVQALLGFLQTNFDETENTLLNSDRAIDYLMTARSLDLYDANADEEAALFDLARASQLANGSFDDDVEATVLAAQSFATSDLSIVSVTPVGQLRNRESATFQLVITNKGYVDTTDIDVYAHADNVRIGELLNLQDQGVTLGPGDSVNLELNLPSEALLGSTNMTFYVEGVGEDDYDNNWFDGVFTFAPASNGAPANTLFYEAHKPFNANSPLIYFRWHNKPDVNRTLYVVAYRINEDGQGWNYVGVNTAFSQYVLDDELQDNTEYQVYVTVYDGQLIYSTNVTTVSVSSNPTAHVASVTGQVNDSTSPLPDATLRGLEYHGTLNDDATFQFFNVGNGTHALTIDQEGYTPIIRRLAIPEGQVDVGRFITHLAPDSTAPAMTTLEIVGEGNGPVEHDQEVTLRAVGTDNIAIQEFDFYYRASVSDTWHFIATARASSNEATIPWFVDSDLLGTGYQLRSVARDYRGNESAELLFGPFEIVVATPKITFTRVTNSPIVSDARTSEAAVWFDYDNDSDDDLFVARYGETNSLYQNDGNGSFTSVSAGDLTSDQHASYSASAADYDNDGDVDVFVANYRDPQTNQPTANALYTNNGDGTFTREAESPLSNYPPQNPTFSVRRSFGSTWFDYNNDGLLDLYVTNFYQQNQLYQNTGDGFTLISSGAPVGDVDRSYGVSAVDIDNDRDIDLFVANAHFPNEQDRNGAHDTLYVNNGSGAYTKVNSSTVGYLVAEDNIGESRGGAWGDYDNDGDMDVFVPNMNGANALYANNGDGTFAHQVLDIPSQESGLSYGSVWGDVDNDGDLDLYVANFDQDSFFYLNDGDNGFVRLDEENITTDPGDQSGDASFADIDGDGDLDLHVGRFATDALFTNDIQNGNHYLTVDLTGRISNRDAIGATVRVTATIGGQAVTQMRQVMASNGMANGQGSRVLHFGLGDATTATEVRIEWPSGETEVLNNVAVDQLLERTEPQPNEPEIALAQGTTSIPDGGSFTIDTVRFGQTGEVVFTVENQGLQPLALSDDPRVSITGDDTAYFTLTADAPASIDPGTSETFTIEFAPDSYATRTVTVSIANNDTDENPYTFTLVGQAPTPDLVSATVSKQQVLLNGEDVQTATVRLSNGALLDDVRLFVNYDSHSDNARAGLFIYDGNVFRETGGVNYASHLVTLDEGGSTATVDPDTGDLILEFKWTISHEMPAMTGNTISVYWKQGSDFASNWASTDVLFDMVVDPNFVGPPELTSITRTKDTVLANNEDEQVVTYTFANGEPVDTVYLLINRDNHSQLDRGGLFRWTANGGFVELGGASYAYDKVALDLQNSTSVVDQDGNRVVTFRWTIAPEYPAIAVGNTISYLWGASSENIGTGWIYGGDELQFEVTEDPNFVGPPELTSVTRSNDVVLANNEDEQVVTYTFANGEPVDSVYLQINRDGHSQLARGGLFLWTEANGFAEIGGVNYAYDKVALDVENSTSVVDQDGNRVVTFRWTIDPEYPALAAGNTISYLWQSSSENIVSGWRYAGDGLQFEVAEDDNFVGPPRLASFARGLASVVANGAQEQTATLTFADGEPVDQAYLHVNHDWHSGDLARGGLFLWTEANGFVELGGASYGSDHVVLDTANSTSVVDQDGNRVVTFRWTIASDYPAIEPNNTLSYLWRDLDTGIGESWTYAGDGQRFDVTAE